ncbi:hypothetical protein FAZ19_22330 [Sphingobacterium alkalisoli]|uniref:O-antigen ligase-related domain-containing protein n=1 Tax=Sphingobacterium alkalisoli TaxID=1874115 RepID=A0A4V6WF13_9SPHI|nr:O-antigen ligase family protein [Sphingobacterium alkalisoli]TJY61359.1 hypothetical protein FAZ19_22330 [Sphingobacterium alkalisoli]GGH30752.1 hypothetical protein GCM10011418_43050 [Sphingobacterium alkalisoli]
MEEMIDANKLNFSRDVYSIIKTLLIALIFLSINVKFGEVNFLSLQLINVVSLLAFAFCFLLTSGFKHVKINKLQFFFIAFLSYALLNSYLNPGSDGLNLAPFFLLVRFFSLIILMAMLGKPRTIIRYVVLSVTFVSIVAVVEMLIGSTFFASDWQNGERYNELGLLVIGSTIASSNHLSLTLIFSIPLVYYLMIKDDRSIYKWMFASILISIFITFSRTGLFLMVVTLFLLIGRKYLGYQMLMKYCLPLLVIGLIAYHAALFINLSNLESFVFDSNDADDSIRYRGYVLIVLLETYLRNPIVGLGSIGSFKRSSVDLFATQSFYKSEVDTSPMNTYLGTLTELGLVGLVLFLVFIFKMLIISWKYYKHKGSIFHYNVLVILLVFLANIVVLDASTFPLLIILIAILSVFYKEYEKTEIN